MPEIGLFPLALVLLPTERVPLHIFEPRYKDLIGECIAESSPFGLLLEDENGRRDIGTRANVVEVLHVFEDGRMNIVVEGQDRFRVLALTQGRSFLTADVELLEDEGDESAESEEKERALELFHRLAEVAEADVDKPEGTSERLSFELAARVEFGLEPKQQLLELRSEPERLRRLCELLHGVIQAMTRERAVRELAAGNGRLRQA